jgi:membrane protein DedA with SNARE-associated domain
MLGAMHVLTGFASLDPSTMDRLVVFATAHIGWVLPLVAFIGFLKSIAIIAVFIPSTAFFVALAAVYSAAGGTFAPLWLAAAAGATSGDVLSYLAGRHYRADIPRLWPISKSPDMLEKGEGLFRQWGVWSVLGAKFIWGVRPFIPIIAGMYRMPFAIFLAATNLSSLIWAAIGIGAGFGIWRLWS